MNGVLRRTGERLAQTWGNMTKIFTNMIKVINQWVKKPSKPKDDIYYTHYTHYSKRYDGQIVKNQR